MAEEIGAELIVIGLPLNMDGTEGERATKSRKLAKTVEIWSGLPVRMWDERQTTCAAADLLDESGTFGTKRKEILDSVSATVILDDYLAWRKEHPGKSDSVLRPDDLECPPLCSGHIQRKIILISRLSRPAELVGARPLHLLTQTARRLKAPLGLSLLRKRGPRQTHFHRRVVEKNGIETSSFK